MNKFIIFVGLLSAALIITVANAESTRSTETSGNTGIAPYSGMHTGPGSCSVNSPPVCANVPTYSDCMTSDNYHGNCFPVSDKGSDGNASCVCGIGE